MNDATSTLSANARSDAAVATDTAPLPAAQAARVLRNTYVLLSMTLLFSAAVAAGERRLRLSCRAPADAHAGRLLRPAVR